MPTPERTLVLIDPSSPDGETGLDVIAPDGGDVTLLLLLDHASSGPIAEFADAECISMSDAAGIYLQQVADRVPGGHTVEMLSTVGNDVVDEILHAARTRAVSHIVVPASLPGLGGTAMAELVRANARTVVIASTLAAA